MIPITPEIIGPGIEEDYADALAIITRLEAKLAPFETTNDTREGRMKHQLRYLRRGIQSGQMPLPLDGGCWRTLSYLIAEGELSYLGCGPDMEALARILDGVGLIKRRHHPVVLANLDNFMALLDQAPRREPEEAAMVDDLMAIRRRLIDGEIDLPVAENEYQGWRSAIMKSPNFDELPDYAQQRINIWLVIFGGWRPKQCRKGPLAPPNPPA